MGALGSADAKDGIGHEDKLSLSSDFPQEIVDSYRISGGFVQPELRVLFLKKNNRSYWRKSVLANF